MSRVLLVSASTWLSTANVPRLLHAAGAHVTFLGPRDAWPLRGSHVDRALPAEGDPTAIARALERHLAHERYDWVVIGDDPLLDALRRIRDEPWVAGVLPVPNDARREGLLGTKVGFVRALQDLGLPLPESHVCLGREAIAAAVEAIGGPALLKFDGLSGGEGCRPLASADDVARLGPMLMRREVVVQRRVAGPTHSVEALYCEGRLAAVLTSLVVHAYPAPFGPSAIRRFKHDARAMALAERIGRASGMHGFANVTMVDDGGTLQVIEFDPRPNALFHLGDALGVPMAGHVREVIARRPPAGEASRLRDDVDLTVPIFPGDVLRATLHRDVKSMAAWLFNLDGRWRYLPQDDARMTRAYGSHIARTLARHAVPHRVRSLYTQVRRRIGR